MNIKQYQHHLKGGNKQLSKNFKLSEFECNCGQFHDTLVDTDLVKKLQQVRDWYGKPISFTSAYRCPMWNEKQGGKPNSYHKKGQGVDISTKKMDNDEATKLFNYCETIFNGCERGNEFIHVDTREVKQNWTY